MSAIDKAELLKRFPVDPVDKLIEEMSELTKALLKARRFGLDSSHPDSPHITNRDEVFTEIQDVKIAVDDVYHRLIGGSL